MADLPIAPGQVYIEVEYDYEYKSKERLVNIQQGDCFLLVKKTNEDWWQVKREEGSKAFYVPAQYVREVRKALMPPPKPIHPGGPTGHARSKPGTLELEPPAEPGVSWRASGYRREPSSPTSPGHVTPPAPRRDSSSHQPPHSPSDPHRGLADGAGGPPPPSQHGNKGGGSDTLPRSRARSPDAGRQPLDVDSAGESLERRTNDSESGDELSGSSTEHLQTSSSHQARPDSPVYSNLRDLKITQGQLPELPSGFPLHTLGDWDTYRDHSGRHFYYNRSTQERTWKPPRARDAPESTGADGQGTGDGHTEPTPLSLSPSFLPMLCLSVGRLPPPSSEDPSLSAYSSQSDSLYGSPACGWSEEMDAQGHTLYVSDYNNEKWIKHVDEQGRPYYYSADGSRSQWELPKLAGDSLKSRSLDRKHADPIVLTKWRHSTTFLEPNDKDAPPGLKPPSPDSDSDPSSPKAPASPSEKCGLLTVTKITEHGKKVRKNWTSSWTVLRGSMLLFAKGQGGGTSWFGSGQSKPEFTVDLRGGSVDWASKDKSSKKNVLELKTRQATELLIQSDNETVINDWLQTLQETICTHAWESDEAIEEDMPESPGTEKQDKEKEHRDSKKGVKYSASVEDRDNKKTRHKLKKFLTRRPTLQSVRDKGYIKDQVFGCSLAELCQRESTSVPSFVRTCIDHVEQNGLHVDGLYRVSGNLAIIQKLRYSVNHDEKVSLSEGKWEDVHVTAGALKMYFRELPEPLFTFSSFHDFVGAIKNSEYKHRVHSIKELVKQLPRPNHDTMQLLFKHLRKVIDHGEENRMTTQSVAIVFGPTLLRPETETLNMAVHMVYQNQIVELILLEYEAIFGK
ncbi:rho GTPase-activating protein 12-like isoform X2 [Gadus macrocephalus]|uniref:rho GTPase-activating protein 12-like isoform X2 n=1 Tax=Gadus macrocephalus TaxID=80720 RepID=UPI0028CB4E26|nr:rho GTPase-activating protein 12-like isoform X2 [Gadus macrocephalus]